MYALWIGLWTRPQIAYFILHSLVIEYYLMVFNMKKVSIFLIAAALIVGMVGCDTPSTGVQISNWHDLDAVRDDPDGTFILINDLN